MLILHGILGSGQNFRSFGRKIARTYPGSTVILADLRGHGDSPSLTGQEADPARGPTLADCVRDVEQLVEDLGVGPDGPTVVCGHSYGGKVAMGMYAKRALGTFGGSGGDDGGDNEEAEEAEEARDDENKRSPATTGASRAYWVLDSRPCAGAPAPASEPNSVASVIAACKSLSPPFASKDAMMKELSARGMPPAITAWMTTNIRPARDDQGPGLVWRFDLSVIEQLFADYGRHDLWPALGRPHPGSDLHLVRATRNPVWQQPGVLADTEAALASNPDHFHVHDIDAGHWLHAEKPQDLFDLMASPAGGLGALLTPRS